ncbi:hypothetical protein ABH931_001795 [Streptacidiphilus sp. MAP12-33]|uniref:hypothetical protein n=1 Tax=Streptacidiphilus sp. MAP12-33 TaxID=3156266 RepID=UPI0035140738
MNDHTGGAAWPVAELDPVRRLRVLAAATPGTTYGELVIDASVDEVWTVATDLERQMPLLINDIRSFTVTSSDVTGRPVEALARSPFGLRARFDIVHREQSCVMQSRFLVGGLAATAEGHDVTRFGFFGGLRIPGVRLVDRVFHPFLHHGAVERFAAQFRP